MARDELRTITHDRFDDNIWGTADSGPMQTHDIASKSSEAAIAPAIGLGHKRNPPRLFFYFGQNDHWVADQTRDALIASRGTKDPGSKGPWMEVDEGGVPHGFCLTRGKLASFVVSCGGISSTLVPGTIANEAYGNCARNDADVWRNLQTIVT